MDRHTRGPVNKPSLRAGRQEKENKRQTQREKEREREITYNLIN